MVLDSPSFVIFLYVLPKVDYNLETDSSVLDRVSNQVELGTL